MIGIESIDAFTQFGVAGLMGALWVWERLASRRHEQQLAEAHHRLVNQREELGVLIGLVQRNTAAIERFEQTQSRLAELIERIDDGRRAA